MRIIPVHEISRYLPHRPPMVWIDEVISYSAISGECRVKLKADGLYMSGNELRPASCLEFIAQAYGFASACHHIFDLDPQSKPLSKAFFASIRNASLPSREMLAQVSTGDVLTISVDSVRRVKQIVSFTGRVRHGDQQLCEAQIKVFRE